MYESNIKEISSIVTGAEAAPVACTGVCAAAVLGSSTPTICDVVEITVAYKAGCGGVTLHGGDVYRIDNDVQCAAVHYGAVSSTVPSATLFLYSAGPRTQFFSVKKNAITTTAQLTSDYGFIFGTSTVCPTIYSYVHPLTSASKSTTVGTVVGGMLFKTSATLVNDAMAVMELAGGPDTVYYIKDVGNRDRFFSTWSGGVLTTASITAGMAFAVYEFLDVYTTNIEVLQSTPVRADCYTWFPGMADTFFGAGAYPWDTHFCLVLRHQQPRAGFLHRGCHEPSATQYYSATMLGFTSTMLTIGGGKLAYSLSYYDQGCVPSASNVARTRINLYKLDGSGVKGYHYYTQDSDVNQAAFIQGYGLPWSPTEVYIHFIGTKDNFFKGTYSDVTSTAYHATNNAIFISQSSTAPTADEVYPIRARMYGTVGQAATGTGVYKDDSDVVNICFHYLSCNIGYTYLIYALHIGTAGYPLYASTHRQQTSLYHTGVGVGQIYVSHHTVAIGDITNEVNIPSKMKLLTRSTTIVGDDVTSPVTGVIYYKATSDIARCALHMGLLRGDANETIYVHQQTVQQKVFYSITNNSIQSTALDTTTAYNTVTLTKDDVVTVQHPDYTTKTSNRAVNFLAITIACLWLPVPKAPDTSFYGVGMFPVGQDLLVAAMMDFRCRPTLDHTDQFTFYVLHGMNTHTRLHGSSTPAISTKQYYSAAAFRAITLNSVASVDTLHTRQALGPTYSNNAVPVRVMYHGALDQNPVYGSRPGPYWWESSIAKAAFFDGKITDPGEIVVVYFHYYSSFRTPQRVDPYLGTRQRGIRSVATSVTTLPTDMAGIVFYNSDPGTSRIAVDVTNNEMYACFGEIHRDMTPDTTGTYWYRYDSDFGIAAFREGMVDFGGCLTMYPFRESATRDWFLPSVQRGYQSSGAVQAATPTYSFILRATTGTAVQTIPTGTGTWANSDYVTITFRYPVIRPWEVSKGVITVSGMNPFTHDTDATYAAYMGHFLNPGDTSVTLRLWHVGNRQGYPGITSRRVVSTGTTVTQRGYALSVNSGGWWRYGIPDSVAGGNYELMVTIEDYETPTTLSCYGAGVYSSDSDLSLCARSKGIAGIGDTLMLYAYFNNGGVVPPAFGVEYANGLQTVGSIATRHAYLIKTGNGGEDYSPGFSDAMRGTHMFTHMQNATLETGRSAECNGHILYARTCNLAAAAHHSGVAMIGENVIVYGKWCGSVRSFLGSTQNGITTVPLYSGGGLESFVVATSTGALNTLCSASGAVFTPNGNSMAVKINIPPYRTFTQAVGFGGLFHSGTPLDVALIESGILDSGDGITTVYVKNLDTVQVPYPRASLFGGLAKVDNNQGGYFVSTSQGTASGFVYSSLTCLASKVRVLDAHQCTGLVIGTNVYRRDTPVGCAAVHAGLVTIGSTSTVTINMCKVTTWRYFIGSTSNGIKSVASSTAMAGYGTSPYEAFVVSTGTVTPPVMGALPYTMSITLKATPADIDTGGKYVEVGRDASGNPYYNALSSDLAAIYQRHGYVSDSSTSGTASIIIATSCCTPTASGFLIRMPTGSPIRTVPSGVNTTQTGVIPGGTCKTITVMGNLGGNVYGSYYYSNNGNTNFAKAAVHAGLVDIGELKDIKVCAFSTTKDLLASVSRHVQSLPLAGATSVVCLTEVSSADCTNLAYTPLRLTYTQGMSAACTSTGAQFTTIASCMNAAAYSSSVINYNTETTVYAITQTGHTFCTFFMSQSRGGKVSAAQATAGSCIYLSTSVVGSAPSTPTVTVEYTPFVPATMPIGSYYYDPTVGTINDMLEHQQRITMFNPDTFSVDLVSIETNPPTTLFASTMSGIATTARWTDGAPSTGLTIVFYRSGWNKIASTYRDTHCIFFYYYLQMPTGTRSVGGVKDYWSPGSDMALVLTLDDDGLFDNYVWGSGSRGSVYIRLERSHRIPTIYAAWIQGQDTFATSTGTHDYAAISNSLATVPGSWRSVCTVLPRAPAHIQNVQDANQLYGTRYFQATSSIVRAGAQDGRISYANKNWVQSKNIFICMNYQNSGTRPCHSLTNNSVKSWDIDCTRTFVFATSQSDAPAVWTTTNEYVTNVQIKSVLEVRTVIGGMNHIVRPFDITESLVSRYDEREFSWFSPMPFIYLKSNGVTSNVVHRTTCNGGLTREWCGAAMLTYLITDINSESTRPIGTYRSIKYYTALSPRYFYHTIESPTGANTITLNPTTIPRVAAFSNIWGSSVYGAFNEYASQIPTCPSRGSYQILASGGTQYNYPYYFTDLRAAYWESDKSTFNDAYYNIYVHYQGAQTRGVVSNNKNGFLTSGIDFYLEKSPVTHGIFSLSSNNVAPTFSATQQVISMTRCVSMDMRVYGTGVHTLDSDPCGMALQRNLMKLKSSTPYPTFYIQYYRRGFVMPFFVASYSYGVWSNPERLSRDNYCTLSTVSGSQDTTVVTTHTSATVFEVQVKNVQVVPSFQFSSYVSAQAITTYSSLTMRYTTETTVAGATYYYTPVSPVTDILLHTDEYPIFETATDFKYKYTYKSAGARPQHYPMARNGPWPSAYGNRNDDNSYHVNYRYAAYVVWRTDNIVFDITFAGTDSNGQCTPAFPVHANPLNCPTYVHGVGMVWIESDVSCAAWLTGKCLPWEVCYMVMCYDTSRRSIFHHYNKLGLLNLHRDGASGENAWWVDFWHTTAIPSTATTSDSLFCLKLNCTNRPTGFGAFPGVGSTHYQMETELCTAGMHFNILDLDQMHIEICTTKISSTPQGYYYSSSRRHVITSGVIATGTTRYGFVMGIAATATIPQPSIVAGIEVCPEYVQSTTCPGTGGYNLQCDLSIAVYREGITQFARCYTTKPYPINVAPITQYPFVIKDEALVGNRVYGAGSQVTHMTIERFKSFHTSDYYIMYIAWPLVLPVSTAAATVVTGPLGQACTATSDIINCALAMGFITNSSVGERWIVKVTYDFAGNYLLQRFNPSTTVTLSQSLSISDSTTASVTLSLSDTPSLSTTSTLSVSTSQSMTMSLSITDTITPPPTPTVSMTMSLSITDTITPPPTPTMSMTMSLSITDTITPPPTPTTSMTMSISETSTSSESVTMTITPPPTPTISISLSTSTTLSNTLSQTTSTSLSQSDTLSQTDSMSLSDSTTLSLVETQSLTISSSLTTSTTLSPTTSLSVSSSSTQSQTVSISFSDTLSISSSTSLSVSTSVSASSTLSQTGSISLSASGSLTTSVSTTISESLTLTIPETQSLTISSSVSTSTTLSPTTSLSFTDSLSLTDSISLTESTSLSLSTSLSVTESTSLSASSSLSETTSLSVTDSLSLTDSTSLSVSTSVSTSSTLSLTGSISLSVSESITVSDSLSLTDSISLTASESLTLSDSLSLTDSTSLTASQSLTLTDSLSLTDSMSLTESTSLSLSTSLTTSSSETMSFTESYTDSFSKTLSLPLTITHPESMTLSISMTDSIPETDSVSISNTISMSDTMSIPPTDSISISYSISASDSVTPTTYQRLKTITFGKELIFKNPVTEDPNGTIPVNRGSLIDKALEDAVSNPIWFLFVVCLVAALAALVLLVLIAIAAYRRWKRMKKEEHMTRRATKYIKRGRRAKMKKAGILEDGESMDMEEGEGDTEDPSTDQTGQPNDAIVDFDDIGETPHLEPTQWTSFRKEFAGNTEPMGGKKALKKGKDGGGAKLEMLNVAQFNRRTSDEDPHLMPNKKKNTFVDDVLDTEAKAKLKRLQSLSVMFTEATRDKGATDTTPSGAANEVDETVDELANSITAMAAASETFKNQLEQDGRRRLAEAGDDDAIDPTTEEYAELCRRTSAHALRALLATAGGTAAAVGGATAGTKALNRHRRGSGGAGFTGIHPSAVVKSPEEIQAEADRQAAIEEQKRQAIEEDGGVAGPTYGGRGGGKSNKGLNDTLDGYRAFDFENNADVGNDGVVDPTALKAEPDAVPTAAIAATTATAPINLTRKGGINAIRLGNEVDEYDDFEPDEEYDFSHLTGKAQTAVTAEAMLGTQFKPKRPQTGGTNRSSTNRSAVSAGDINLNFFDAGDADFDVDAIAAELGLNDRDDAAPSSYNPHSSVPIPPEEDGFDFDMDDQGPSAPQRPVSHQASTQLPPPSAASMATTASPQPRPSVFDDLHDVDDDEELDLDAAEMDLGDLGIDRLNMRDLNAEQRTVLQDQDVNGLFDDVDID